MIDDLLDRMANITLIMDHHEGLGTTKNKFLVAEYQRCETELHKALQKEQENEARKRTQQSGPAQAGTPDASGQPGRSGPTGPSDGQPTGSDPAILRQDGIYGSDQR